MRPSSFFRTVYNYATFGRNVWSRLRFRNPQAQQPYFQQRVLRYPPMQLVRIDIQPTTVPYYNAQLMAHLRRHLPDWNGFHTEVRTYFHSNWNSIYGDWDLEGTVVRIERPLLQRDRLMQIFQACPEGSYGYYAARGLAPFKSVVGSLAASTIDEFFASQVHWLKQGFSDAINDIMSTMETDYWESREDLVEWLAGRTFTKWMREVGVAVPAYVLTIWEGKRKPSLPEGEAPEEEQLQAAANLLKENLPKLNRDAVEAYSVQLWEEVLRKRKAKEALKEESRS
jgi:hypothetical protein